MSQGLTFIKPPSERQKRQRRTAILIAIAIFLASTIAIAAVVSTVTTHNEAMLDTVDIEIIDKTPDGDDVLYNLLEDENDERIWDLSINNKGSVCWVRAKVTARGPQGVEDLSAAQISSPEWSKNPDGWYYLLTPLADPGSVDFDAIVSAPDAWGDARNYKFFVDVDVQAVQRAHVEPDFASGNPWHGIQPRSTLHTRLAG